MRFLVTGAAGQLGQAFKRYFDERKIDYVLADINRPFESVEYLDITKVEEVHKFVKHQSVDYVINCAAYNDVDGAETDSRMANLVNGKGTQNLALAAKESGAGFVHYSTDYVFDGKKNSPYTIDDTPSPISKYGESKLLGETLLQDTSAKYLMIRVSWLFGIGQVNFPGKVLDWSKGRDELKIVDDQIASPTYVDDVTAVTMDLLKIGALGLFHITNSGFCSRYEWAEYILNTASWEGILNPAKSSDFKTAAQRPEYSVLDNDETEAVLGYALPDWKDATTRFLEQLNSS